jgi:deoxyribonuclease-4
MPILGAHQSIAGGYYKAVERAAALGCQCVQVFTKNTNQWRAKPIAFDEAQRFRAALGQNGVTHCLAHDSYLINLASPDRALWQKSVEAFAVELLRAKALGIPYVVTHPGACISGPPTHGLRRVIDALIEVFERVPDEKVGCLLETTAGQGTSLGWQFKQLALILDNVDNPGRLGICFDTCHVFAAGYRLRTRREYRATMQLFDDVVGLHHIRAFHLNDSARERGSRVDRHAHIGRGQIGREMFRCLLRDRRFDEVPMYLETPKGEEDGVDLDEINLRTLRRLAAQPAAAR